MLTGARAMTVELVKTERILDISCVRVKFYGGGGGGVHENEKSET